MRKSLDEIRNSFAGRKKANEKQTPLCYYVVRPLSFYLTWLILPLGVSANQVSIFSFLIGLSGCISLSFGYDVGVYVGSILILIVWLLDHIDGNIARTTKTASSYGAFLDSALGTIVYFAFSFSLGIALYNTPDDKLQSMLRFLFKTKTELRPELFLFLGMANASFILLKEFFSIQYLGLSAHKDKGAVLEETKEWKSMSYNVNVPNRCLPMYLVYINILSNSVRLPWLLVAAFTKSLSIFLAFYAIVYLLDLLVTEAWHIHRIKEITSS